MALGLPILTVYPRATFMRLIRKKDLDGRWEEKVRVYEIKKTQVCSGLSAFIKRRCKAKGPLTSLYSTLFSFRSSSKVDFKIKNY